MAPNKGAGAGKAAAKAAKKAKQVDKAAKKEAAAIKSGGNKGKGKGKLDDEEEDLDKILERYQAEMLTNAAMTVTTLDGWPAPRCNALLLPTPSTLPAESNHLYLLFGEYFDGSRATFYNSTLRYDIVKNEWKEYKSPEAPAPRSSAAGVCVPGLGDGGGILIFGGEYASPTQTSFHHFKDLWLFSIKSHSWERFDFRKGPSGRSGHRMVLWKQFVILFGGFIDVGVKTNYLSDLWLFDLEDYKWRQIEHLDKDRCPTARSGFSFIPCPEGAILHGGYRKEYVKGTRPKGVHLEDTWLLRMDTDINKIKWEKRRRLNYAPTLRSGCTMTYWASKGMGVLFGGVLDDERDEESMESTFYNDLYAYYPAGNGRWMSLNLKRKKGPGGKRRKRATAQDESLQEDENMEDGDEDSGMAHPTDKTVVPSASAPDTEELEADADDPAKSVPLTRYNAMIAIMKNTLFIYGGMFETSNPAREYTLDDFITLNLDKLDRFVHIRSSGLDELEWMGSDDEGEDSTDAESRESTSEDDDDDAGSMDGLEETGDIGEEKEKRYTGLSREEKDALRASATRFLGVAKDSTRSEEDVLSTPFPGENIRTFYDRSRQYWASLAYARTGSRGKCLRREGFELASQKYALYKPILEEIERIQREAEVSAAEMGGGKRAPAGEGAVARRR